MFSGEKLLMYSCIPREKPPGCSGNEEGLDYALQHQKSKKHSLLSLRFILCP